MRGTPGESSNSSATGKLQGETLELCLRQGLGQRHGEVQLGDHQPPEHPGVTKAWFSKMATDFGCLHF